MGLVLWALVAALAVSATLGYPKGPDWQHIFKQNYLKERKDLKYQYSPDTLADAYEITFQRSDPTIKRTRALEKGPGKNI